MPDDDKPTPNPIEDLRKGLGLLIRAARTTIEQLPTGKLEDSILSGAKEVGRAIENVAQSVEQQILGKKSDAPKPADAASSAPAPSSDEAKRDEPEPGA